MTRSAPHPAVRVLSRWTGYCLPCDATDRPLVLVWSGPPGLRTRLLGPPPGIGDLRLTCALCGGVDAVGWEDEHVDEALLRDDPVVEPVVELVVQPVVEVEVEAGVQVLEPVSAEPVPGVQVVEAVVEQVADAHEIAVEPEVVPDAGPVDVGLELLAAPPYEAPASELPVLIVEAEPLPVDVLPEAAVPALAEPAAPAFVPALSADVAAALRDLAVPAPRSADDLAALELLDRS